MLAASAKLVDFGNACWVHRHFTSDIQTRQYRCPEVAPPPYPCMGPCALPSGFPQHVGGINTCHQLCGAKTWPFQPW